MRRQDGFTLIELLIVVAIIAIIAAVALPQLVRARLAGNEASAIAALRSISSSESNYAATCGNGGYATDLADLVKPPPGTPHGFISPDLGANFVQKSGYVLSVVKNASPLTIDVLLASCNGAAAPRASLFYASAVPVTAGVTGNRFFATDTPGTIFQDLAAAIANPIPVVADTIE
jgi:prepilin-type N-terminal cleavage/methylation domain-containing protein